MALINTSIALPIDFRLNFEVIENDKTLINDNFNTQIQQSFVSIRFVFDFNSCHNLWLAIKLLVQQAINS